MNEFLRGYLECALWSSQDDNDEGATDYLDATYTVEDFAPEALAQAVEDCQSFEETCAVDLARYYAAGFSVAHAGYDFWLTRNGHGAGFWDRGLGEVGERLAEMTRPFGGVDLYVGDDGRVHAA